MNIKDLDSAVESAGSLIKNFEPILNRAEKWNKGQRVGAAVVSLTIAVLLLSGTLPPTSLIAFALVILAISLLTIKRKVLEAEMFVIKDKEGRHRAAFALENNNVSLIFFDQKEDARVLVGLTNKDEPILSFFDPNLKPRVALTIPADTGSADFHLKGSNGESYFQCHVSKDNSSNVWLGRPTSANIMMAADVQGQTISFSDKENRLRASLNASETTSVVRLESNTKASAEMGVYDEAMPGLLFNGESGKAVVLLGPDKNGSGKLDVFDNNGSLMQRIP